MTHRYALRFEDGERRGEIVTVTGATTTFGRKPGNTVQVLDPSVSGKHAELLVDDRGALLRDLGSTNGTRVHGERVSELRLAVGDRFVLGNIGLTLIDPAAPTAGVQAPPADEGLGLELEHDQPPPARPTRAPAAAPSGELVADAGEAVRSIGAEKLARSGKKSTVAGVVLVLLAGGAAAAWWFTRDGSGGTAPARRAVTAVPGNLLAAGYSFETADLPAGWTNEASATAAFESDRDARVSGEQGLAAELGPAGTALLVSPAVTVNRGIRLACSLGTEGAVQVRAGLRLESSSNAHLPIEAWGAWKTAEGGAEDFELTAAAPATYDRARALIAARSTSEPGRALVDDVALVAASDAAPHAVKNSDDVELILLGEPASSALLFKIDHPLISGIRFLSADGTELRAEAAQDPLGMRISTGEPAVRLEFHAETKTAEGGVATTGRDGFKTHQAQFEREAADSLLLGAGRDLVRIRFASPVTVRGRPSAGESGASFVLEAVGAKSALLQVAFTDEKVTADALAREATAAEAENKPARVIAAWTKLIDEHPIDAALVEKAEAGRARMLSAGLGAVTQLKGDVERARFFRLLDLFRECRDKALVIAKDYAGSEVETGARALAESVEKDIEVLARDLDRLEAQRLARIHAALVASEQKRLAERVASELKARFQVDDPATLLAPDNGGR